MSGKQDWLGKHILILKATNPQQIQGKNGEEFQGMPKVQPSRAKGAEPTMCPIPQLTSCPTAFETAQKQLAGMKWGLAHLSSQLQTDVEHGTGATLPLTHLTWQKKRGKVTQPDTERGNCV